MPSLTIAPNLRLIECLGEGGMGSVWLADHLTLHTRVVVKLMARDLDDDPEAIARFSREAAAAARVRSPHVVQMFDHGVTDDGVPYIVMELLNGRDLCEHLEEVGTLTPHEATTLVTQIASALTRAHELGIVHRDIKPENIFLTDLGNGSIFVKLVDFGIARGAEMKLSRLTKTGVSLGTPFYMSPECLLDPNDVSPAADLWALAAVAYETLTGTRAFPGDTIAGVTLSMHNRPSPRPSLVVKEFPAAVDAWFARALALDPGARFPDAASMANAFASALAGVRVSRAPRAGNTLPFESALVAPLIERKSNPGGARSPRTEPRTLGRAAAWVALLTVAAAIVVVNVMLSRHRANAAAMANPTPTAAPSADPSPRAEEAPSVVVAVASAAPTQVASVSATATPSRPKAKTTQAKKAVAEPGVPKVFDDVQ